MKYPWIQADLDHVMADGSDDEDDHDIRRDTSNQSLLPGVTSGGDENDDQGVSKYPNAKPYFSNDSDSADSYLADEVSSEDDEDEFGRRKMGNARLFMKKPPLEVDPDRGDL